MRGEALWLSAILAVAQILFMAKQVLGPVFFSLGVGKYCFLSLCLQLTRLCFCGIMLQGMRFEYKNFISFRLCLLYCPLSLILMGFTGEMVGARYLILSFPYIWRSI